ncbi:MAG: TlpA family protein disulfide reductase [Bacteroidales bacterium]
MMNRYLVFTLLIFGTLWEVQGQTAFQTPLSDLEGNTVSIDAIKGEKLTVLDFWATWCRPCINSIPELVKLSDKYQDQGVHFVGINADSPRNSSKVKPFASSVGITYPVLLDFEQQLQSDFFISGFPTLLILDGKGKVLFTHVGFIQGDEKIIEDAISKLLTEMP